MPNVLDLIEALDEMYFNEKSSTERYKILHTLEEAIATMRLISANEIKNEQDAENLPQIELISDEMLLAEIANMVRKHTTDDVQISFDSKVLDIENYNDIDSLTMMEILIDIEIILGIEIFNISNFSDETTFQDIFNIRK